MGIDEYIRAGLRPRTFDERRVERCYAVHFKAIGEEVEGSGGATVTEMCFGPWSCGRSDRKRGLWKAQ